MNAKNYSLKQRWNRIIIILLIMSVTAVCTAQFAGGSGTETDPWQIATVEHLNNVRNYLGYQNEDKHFLLTANINLGIPPYNEGVGWQPIGNSDVDCFSGNFDGNGFIIDGLYINRPASEGNEGFNLGLFGITWGAVISDLGLTNINITGEEYVGSLIGDCMNSSIINCYSTGNVFSTKPIRPSPIQGFGNIGGLIGVLGDSRVENSYSECNVTGHIEGSGNIGGLVGTVHSDSIIINCYSTGNVSGDIVVGGLVGIFYRANIKNSYSSSRVTGFRYVGGLAGVIGTNGHISNSFSTGDVWGHYTEIGGLIGDCAQGTIWHCYSTSSVGGMDLVGGLVGRISENSSLYYNYSVGSVMGKGDNTGGLIGFNPAELTILSSYWNIESSGQNNSAGGEGKTTGQMMSREIYLDWRFGEYWLIDEGTSYPYHSYQESSNNFNRPGASNLKVYADMQPPSLYLEWETIGSPSRFDIYRNGLLIDAVHYPIKEWTDYNVAFGNHYNYYVIPVYLDGNNERENAPSNTNTVYLTDHFAGGLGTYYHPWQIASAEHLNNIRNYIGNEHQSKKHYIQTANISLNTSPYNEGEGWEPLGDANNPFYGYYDGDYHNIYGLFINRPETSYQGLFGKIVSSDITQVALLNVDITASGTTGSLAAVISNYSTISKSCSTGDVTGSYNTGSLVGISDMNSGINNSYSRVNITGSDYLGGMLGKYTTEPRYPTYNGTPLFINNYCTGSLTREEGEYGDLFYIGGLIGEPSRDVGFTSSYFNSDNWTISVHTQGSRTTADMTFPYAENTYFNWDFEEIWQEDVTGDINDGYPYLRRMSYVSVEEEVIIPQNTLTLTNYPNPFNPDTIIRFTLPQKEIISLEIYNIKGQKVKTLADGTYDAGEHTLIWEGNDERGSQVASGLYFYRLLTQEKSLIRKMMMIK